MDFQEVAVGLSVLFGGSLEERLRLAFRAYDLDGDDRLSLEEYAAIMKASFTARGFDFSDEVIREICQVPFKRIDKQRKGYLNFQQFSEAVLSNEVRLSIWFRCQDCALCASSVYVLSLSRTHAHAHRSVSRPSGNLHWDDRGSDRTQDSHHTCIKPL